MTVIKSCGCVFCDLDLKPVKDEAGQLVHVVMVARRKEIVPCQRVIPPSTDREISLP